MALSTVTITQTKLNEAAKTECMNFSKQQIKFGTKLKTRVLKGMRFIECEINIDTLDRRFDRFEHVYFENCTFKKNSSSSGFSSLHLDNKTFDKCYIASDKENHIYLRDSTITNSRIIYNGLQLVNLRRCEVSDTQLYNMNCGSASYQTPFSGTNFKKCMFDYCNFCGVNMAENTTTDCKFCGCCGHLSITPETGSYIGYKKAFDGRTHKCVIVKLEILASAKRSSATGRKCRASKAKVLSITDLCNQHIFFKTAISSWDSTFTYEVGKIVEVSNFDDNRWNECAPGIHHFLTRQEAVNY